MTEHPSEPYPLDHIVIYASDLDASVRYYTDVLGALGFCKERNHVFGRRGLFIDVRAALEVGPPYRRGRPGVDHLGFTAADRAAVDDIDKHVQRLGHVRRLIEFDNGDYALFLTDPDGVRIEITAYGQT